MIVLCCPPLVIVLLWVFLRPLAIRAMRKFCPKTNLNPYMDN